MCLGGWGSVWLFFWGRSWVGVGGSSNVGEVWMRVVLHVEDSVWGGRCLTIGRRHGEV